MNELMQKHNAVIIVTDSYAGNFEREMAAYIVGTEDEYLSSGWKKPDDYAENCEFFEDLFNESFDKQCYQPAEMTTYPGELYNSVAILTEWEHDAFKKEYPEHYAKILIRAKEFCKIQCIGFIEMHWMEITPLITTHEIG